jgi:predicted MFS family arabinose efflux permease
VVYLDRIHRVHTDDIRLGLFYAFGSAGSLIGSLLLMPLNRRFPVGRLLLLAFVSSLTIAVGLLLAKGYLVATICFFLWQGLHTFVVLCGISLRQALAPDDLQARVNVTARMIAWGGLPLGGVAAGLLTEAMGVRLAMFLICLIGLFGIVVALRSTLWSSGFVLPDEDDPSAEVGAV